MVKLFVLKCQSYIGDTMVNFFARYIGIKNILFFIIAILFLVFITRIKDIAILFFASFVISCSLNPLVDKLTVKMKRSLAAGVVLLGSLLIVMLFLVPIIYMGAHQISSFIQLLPEHFENIKNFLLGIPFLSNTELSDMDIGSIVSSATGITSNVVSGSITLSKGLASGLIYFLAGCIIIYYFLADKDTVHKCYLSLFPKQIKNKAENIIETISQKIGGYVAAQVITMASVGLIIMLGLLILNIEYAVLLGLMAAIFDIIPIVGPAIAFVVIMLVVFKLGALKIGLVILLFAFAQWAENNLIRPYIFGKFLNLHPLIIYFFLFVTAQYFGLIGVIFAPAVAATCCVLIEELYIKSIN